MAPVTAAARLGRELRRLRQQRGLSQRALVRALGLSAHSNLVQYELGRRIPPGDIVAACARMLRDDSGILHRLHAEALAERAEVAAERAPRPEPPRIRPAPAMLPAAVADFTGRAAQLAQLSALASGEALAHREGDDTPQEREATAPAAVVVAVIAGTAGIGKTALAVRFAHRAADRFPDGQLYVDLRGYDTVPPLAPGQALAVLLHALGTPAEQVPADAERAAGLYRSLLAGKRMLIVLDNAHRADHVRPLLPGTPGCLVLVTSRDRLSGLIARDGARRLLLDPMAPAEAEALLARMLGPGRVAAEPESAAELARRCAYLPLALRIAAANLVDDPHRGIAALAAELEADDPLGVLTVPGDERGAVRAAFASSYTRLPTPARRLFRLLGLVPGPDVTVEAAAALAAVPDATAADLLGRLATVHLLAEPAPGRFTCHDLLKRYAAERARHDERDEDRAAAVARLHDWYLHGTAAAGRLLYPGMSLLSLPAPTIRPPGFDDGTRALAWLEAERANLLAAVAGAGARTEPLAWLLTDALRGYFWLRLYTVDWMAAARTALAAAATGSERRAQIAARLSLADAYQSQGRHREALRHYHRVLTLAQEDGWAEGEVVARNGLGRVYWQTDRLDRAVDHLSRALEIDRATGSVRGQAVRLANLGAMYHEMGRLRETVDHYLQALAIARETGQRRGEGICLANLGMTYHEMGRMDEAFRHLDAALALAREIGDPGNEAHVLRVLAEAHADAGRPDRALELARAAVAVADEIDDRHYQVEALNTLAGVRQQRGDTEEAAECCRLALKLAREAHSRYPEIVALIGLASAQRVLGRPDDAVADARHALGLARGTGYRVLAGHALIELAEAHATLGRLRPAIQHARRALAVHRETGHHMGETRALAVLDRVRVP
jgi:tetratricopeptide (TPR) repeat protein/transcriptional regulator with XRE-family HTH domain